MPRTGKLSPRDSKRVATDRSRLTTRLAIWLEAQLVDKDWSQLELASKSRVSQPFINGILRHGRLPEDDTVRALARAFHQDVAEPISALYLDRIERLLENAPPPTRLLFVKLMKK